MNAKAPSPWSAPSLPGRFVGVGFPHGLAILLPESLTGAVHLSGQSAQIGHGRKGHCRRDDGPVVHAISERGCDPLLHRDDVHVANRPILGQSTLNVAECAGPPSELPSKSVAMPQ